MRPQHVASRPWWARWWVIGGSLLLVAGGSAGFVVANRSPSAAESKAKAIKVASEQQSAAQAKLLSQVTISPAAGAAAVPLDAHVTVSTKVGGLASVVVSSGGATVDGRLNDVWNGWTSTGPLQPSSTYTVTVKVAAPGGLTAEKQSTFTTITPAALVSATVFPTTGLEVGVGQPIVVNFDHNIDSVSAQKAVESLFTISESQPVAGGWYWFSPHELHFRPRTFWPTGEQVQYTANLGSWNAGEGRWGAGQISQSFTVGDSRVSYANLQSEQMTVTLNGQTIATYPISGGRPQYPTMDGTHLVLDRESVVHMVSSTVGIPVNSPNGYDEFVYDDVHISDSGEYVHAAPWSVGSQGRTNVSHGCINLSSTNARSFYDFSRVGDIVEVTGSPRPPVSGDHGVMDWDTPWSQWAPGRVVHLVGSVPAPSSTSTTVGSYQAPAATTATTSAPTTSVAPTTTSRPATPPTTTRSTAATPAETSPTTRQ